MAQDTSSEPIERTWQTFPLSNWTWLANWWGDGEPLPQGVDWDAYTVEVIYRLVTANEDVVAADGRIPSFGLLFEPSVTTEVRDPDGTFRLETRAGANWLRVRVVIRHPDVVATLQWIWEAFTPGRIAIVGLEEDPDPELSCRVLVKAIPLLRDYEWRGKAKPGRPELTDDDVRHDLVVALARCRRKGWERPSVRQLADEHDRRFDSVSDEVGLSEIALRERMRSHPGPFDELAPWVVRRPKR